MYQECMYTIMQAAFAYLRANRGPSMKPLDWQVLNAAWYCAGKVKP